MTLIKEIKDILNPIANQYNIIINDVKLFNEGNEKILEIPIMFSDKTMDLETCSIMSEYFSEALDAFEKLDFAYMLDVCSPGAERLLNSYEEIVDELNNYVYVKLKDPKAGLFEIYGDLVEVNEDFIVIKYMDKTRAKTFEISVDNISLIRLAIKF